MSGDLGIRSAWTVRAFVLNRPADVPAAWRSRKYPRQVVLLKTEYAKRTRELGELPLGERVRVTELLRE